MNIRQSKLLEILSKLNIASQESISAGNNLTKFEKYIHVDRQIQKDLIKQMEFVLSQSKKHLIFLTGSSGDGKSHLFSILEERDSKLFDQFEKHYDATASTHPDKSAIDSLLEGLDAFSDENLYNSNNNSYIIQAINLGILNNFISNKEAKRKYSLLIKFIHESGIFGKNKINRILSSTEQPYFSIVNFGGYNDLEFENDDIISQFYNNIFNKITCPNKSNIFYQAYLSDKEQLDTVQTRIVCTNFEMLCNQNIKQTIIKLLIMARVKNKIILTTRLLLDFIYRILVPSNIYDVNLTDDTPFVYLPYLLFESENKGRLNKPFKDLDILNFRAPEIDSMINEYYLLDTLKYEQDLKTLSFGKIFFDNRLKKTKASTLAICAFYIRLCWLLNLIEIKPYYKDYNYYCKLLQGYYCRSNSVMDELDELVTKAFYKWFGDEKSSIVYLGNSIENIKLGYEFELVLDEAQTCLSYQSEKENVGFLFEMPLTYFIDNSELSEKIELNYSLLILMKRIVEDNYKPSIVDEDNFLPFVIFAKQLIKKGQNSNLDLYIINSKTNSKYILKKQPKNSSGKKFKFIKK